MESCLNLICDGESVIKLSFFCSEFIKDFCNGVCFYVICDDKCKIKVELFILVDMKLLFYFNLFFV